MSIWNHDLAHVVLNGLIAQVLLDMQLVTADELKDAIATEYNPARIAFHESFEMWIEDVLNLGIVPRQAPRSWKMRSCPHRLSSLPAETCLVAWPGR